MAEESVLKEYWYKLKTKGDGTLRFRAVENRGNATKITATLLEIPPRRRMKTVDAWEIAGDELRVSVPTPIQFARAPHLWICYHIRKTSAGAGEYEAVCEFTGESMEIELVPDEEAEKEVVDTIEGDSFRITGSLGAEPGGVNCIAWVELAKGEEW